MIKLPLSSVIIYIFYCTLSSSRPEKYRKQRNIQWLNIIFNEMIYQTKTTLTVCPVPKFDMFDAEHTSKIY